MFNFPKKNGFTLLNTAKRQFRFQRNYLTGFTLIEVSFVMAIIIVLVFISLVALFSLREKSHLGNNVQAVVDVLRLARNKSIASEKESNFGVHFDKTISPNKYTLFRGSSYNQRQSSDDIIFELSRQVNFQQINLISDDVIFSRISGSVIIGTGDVKLGLISDPLQNAIVYIDSSGKVSLSLASAPSLPVKDSRHVHFNYNNNVKEAVILRLIFPDYPGDNYDINFQNYLTNGKTEFNWSGTVLVGPEGNKTEQKLKIHTHSLTDFAAQFSVHRDRMYNDKALNITLDSQNLINYTADGQESEGLSAFVEPPERQ